jgi:hypothetical protein
MDTIRKVSNRCLLLSFLWFLILGAWLAFYLNRALETIQTGLRGSNPVMIELMMRNFEVTFWQVLGASIFFAGLFLWSSYRLSIRGIVGGSAAGKRIAAKEPSRKETGRERKAAVEDSDRRRSLLVMSLLQREGRLIDFLEENLQDYDDAQIGAAVRSIQENCKKSLNKYLDLQPVIEKKEGEEITVPPGFDADAIKLTGNVSGQPPFKGTLQHHGWKAGRIELPALSGTVDSDIICPAEVEIT